MGAAGGRLFKPPPPPRRTARADLDDRPTDGRIPRTAAAPPHLHSVTGRRAGDDSACVEWTQDAGFPAWASGDSLTNLQRANGSASPVSFKLTKGGTRVDFILFFFFFAFGGVWIANSCEVGLHHS